METNRNETTIKTDVIIAGAGPTGLSLAVQLLRYNIPFLIFDKKEGTTNLSKALVVHARTLEIYDQMGLAQLAFAEGAVTRNVAILHGGKIRANLDFAGIGGTLSPFPFMLMLEQSKNEKLLNDHLESTGNRVQWQTELTGITQSDIGVQAVLKTADGQTKTVEGRYLAGCDGASSRTRHLTELGFEGSTYPRLFYVADVNMEFDGDHNTIHGAFESDSFVLFFPMQEADRWRVIGPLPEYDQAVRENPEKEQPISFDAIQDKIKAMVKRPLEIKETHWFSTYKVHTRHASSFSKGRCFLAGDAAHVHTPTGGQGMNTGIQDAYNLAWKIALVLKGQARNSLLDTYNTERLENAKHLLKTTDEAFDIVAGDTWHQRFLRDNILPGLINFAWRFDAVKELLFPALSQIGISYHASPLSRQEGGKDFKVKAGDRMPYFKVDGANFYDRLNAPLFHLLIFSDGENHATQEWAQMETAYRERIDFHTVPLLPRIVEIFGVKQSFCVLLRPDNYIGFISATLSSADLDAYFGNFNASAPSA